MPYSARHVLLELLRYFGSGDNALMTSLRNDRPQHPRIAVPRDILDTLIAAIQEICRDQESTLSASFQSLQNDADVENFIWGVQEELFGDGCNWGRIVVWLAWCCFMCRCTRCCEDYNLVDAVFRGVLESTEGIDGWIHSHGGWDRFCDFLASRHVQQESEHILIRLSVFMMLTTAVAVCAVFGYLCKLA
ncbi:ORF64 [callitrichine gammaherpesvirus 3]|uniref:ORF64 n=1 Tax=callitrichine gammaherpesvirus 3 TaxID=106331 RepID=Q8BEN2_9GAMA|nr:ORF64 [callitrichine gammaherpesvirus 3]AAN64285.1 ORF64 [callitrichine gammaherpesvirus 3]